VISGSLVKHDADSCSGNIERILQAADWFVRISGGDLSEYDLAEWLEWCGIEANARAFQRIRAIDRSVGRLRR